MPLSVTVAAPCVIDIPMAYPRFVTFFSGI
uniref:Uncharacterized protein n=1 Tax=Arundo donax TaxID=35708 RepID=A0A0A8Z2V9_ARUDO